MGYEVGRNKEKKKTHETIQNKKDDVRVSECWQWLPC